MSNTIATFVSALGIPAGSGYAAGDTFTVDAPPLVGSEHLAIGVIDTVDGGGVAQTFHLSDPGCAGYTVTTNPDGDSVTIATGANTGNVVTNTWFTLSIGACSASSSGYVNHVFGGASDQ